MLSAYASTLLYRLTSTLSAMEKLATMGARLRAAREEKGLSCPQLAKLVGLTRAAINQWETGTVKNIRPDNLINVCDELGVELRWLVTGEGPRYARKNAATRRREARWLAIAAALESERGDELLAHLESRIALERAGMLPAPLPEETTS